VSAADFERPSATILHRVTMADVDAVQANFVAYFRWMDGGFHELLSRLGRPLGSILASGRGTPAVDARCSYLKPVGIDDVVEVRTQIGDVGRSSFAVEHAMAVDGAAVASGLVKHVWVELGAHKHAAPVPGWLRAAGRSTVQ
jgi:4-hydroxybenzoyl-CoA thioesterase